MSPQTIFPFIVALALTNGLVSPVLPVVFAFHPVWWPELFSPTPELIFYAASLLVATGTLLLGGIPAALYERLKGAREPDAEAMWIWFACVGSLTLLGVVSRG